MKALIGLLVSTVALFASSTTFASQTCNTSGADPTLCESKDGKYAFEITANRNITGLGITDKSFCTKSYLKLNGVEVNGAPGAEVAEDGPISYVDSVTSELGVRLANPATHKIIMPVTAIGYVLKNAVDGSDTGYIFVYGRQSNQEQDADLYTYGTDGKVKDYKRLSCK